MSAALGQLHRVAEADVRRSCHHVEHGVAGPHPARRRTGCGLPDRWSMKGRAERQRATGR